MSWLRAQSRDQMQLPGCENRACSESIANVNISGEFFSFECFGYCTAAARPTLIRGTDNNMDLIPLFGATLSPDANERMRAELALRQLESQDGLLTSVVHLVSNAEVDMGVKQAASIYLKNRLSKAWPLDAEDRHQKETSKALPAHFQDRQQVRDSLLPALTVAAPVIKTQLAAALGTVIQNDFPEVRCLFPQPFFA